MNERIGFFRPYIQSVGRTAILLPTFITGCGISSDFLSCESIAVQGSAEQNFKGHRIQVMSIVVWHGKCNSSAEEIVEMFPENTLAEVFAALTYYFESRRNCKRLHHERDPHRRIDKEISFQTARQA